MVRCSLFVPVCVALGFALSACTPKANVGELETDSAEGSGDSGSDEESQTGPTQGSQSGTSDSETGGPEPLPSSKVDVLFVLDNSGSMGEEQGAVATEIATMVAAFDAADLEYRVAVTTSDNGNPWCTGTSPEGGAFRMTSCRSRAAEFMFEGVESVEEFDEGCANHCNLDSITIEPSTTQSDPMPMPRPWVERFADGSSNVGDGASITEALQCALPQGINGCGFEQPLESMYKAVERAEELSENQSSFFRSDAHTVVILVSDEVDCSSNPDHDLIFLPNGNRVFWSLPLEGSPTSAVCWNAGVACSGDGNPYTDCGLGDYDEDGAPAANPTVDAVLHPLERYSGRLADLRQAKSAGDVFVFSISGVRSDGSVVYADAPVGSPNDPNFQDNFGIGPGCTGPTVEAVPPVRVRLLTQLFDGTGSQNLFSICDADQHSAMSAIAAQIIDASP